jgi:hypothetical protein
MGLQQVIDVSNNSTAGQSQGTYLCCPAQAWGLLQGGRHNPRTCMSLAADSAVLLAHAFQQQQQRNPCGALLAAHSEIGRGAGQVRLMISAC